MSMEAIGKVWDICIKPADKLLLIHIADTDPGTGLEGKFFNPESAMLFTGMSEKGLAESLDRLQRQRLITNDHRGNVRVA